MTAPLKGDSQLTFDEMSAIAQTLTHDEIQELQILLDPDKWAYVYFGWESYDYQKPILQILPNSQNTVLRFGRRLGKTECMCIIILWYAYTQYNKKPVPVGAIQQYDILIVTPFENQINLIFKRLNQLLKASPKYQTSVVKNNKHHIVLDNGTNILGITAGTKNNSGAASTRGQPADVLVLDETDYMSEDDITNIRNIRNEDPKRIRMIVASTPSGRRASYYKWCTQSSVSYHADSEHLNETGILRYKVITASDRGIRGNGWTEFYAPSHVNRKLLEINPETNQSYMKDLEDELPSYRYDQEVLALFGEELLGVYQKRFIDYAIKQGYDSGYAYQNLVNRPRKPGNIRLLGVDWDKASAESSLLAYEFDIELGKFIPLDKIAIARGEYTFTIATQKIIELNDKHSFDWIIIDRGYGETQIEHLHIYGSKHPKSGLAKKIIPIHFSNKIPVRDPVTRKIDEKDVKPFMVNNSVNIFEKGMICLDPTDKQLAEQLGNYVIKSTSQDGKPIYSSTDEHFVDALNLCLLGFAMKYDKLLKQQLSSRINTISLLDDEMATNALIAASAQTRYIEELDADVAVPVNKTKINVIKPIGGMRSIRNISGGFQGRKTF